MVTYKRMIVKINYHNQGEINMKDCLGKEFIGDVMTLDKVLEVLHEAHHCAMEGYRIEAAQELIGVIGVIQRMADDADACFEQLRVDESLIDITDEEI